MSKQYDNLFAKLLVLAFCGKFIVLGSLSSIAEALIVISIIAYVYLSEYLTDKALKSKLFKTLEEQQAHIDQLHKDIDFLKTSIAGVKLGQGFKKVL